MGGDWTSTNRASKIDSNTWGLFQPRERQIVAKRKVNKSQQIREFLAANAGVGPTEAAKQLSSQLGTKITPAFVSNIKQKMAKGAGKRRKVRRGKSGQKLGVRTSNSVSNNQPASNAVSVIRAA